MRNVVFNFKTCFCFQFALRLVRISRLLSAEVQSWTRTLCNFLKPSDCVCLKDMVWRKRLPSWPRTILDFVAKAQSAFRCQEFMSLFAIQTQMLLFLPKLKEKSAQAGPTCFCATAICPRKRKKRALWMKRVRELFALAILESSLPRERSWSPEESKSSWARKIELFFSRILCFPFWFFLCRYKLQNGKFVIPSQLEAAIGRSRFIEQVCVHGENLPHNVAIVVPNWPNVSKKKVVVFFLIFFFFFQGCWSSCSLKGAVSRRSVTRKVCSPAADWWGHPAVSWTKELRNPNACYYFPLFVHSWKWHGDAENVAQTQKHCQRFSCKDHRIKVLKTFFEGKLGSGNAVFHVTSFLSGVCSHRGKNLIYFLFLAFWFHIQQIIGLFDVSCLTGC